MKCADCNCSPDECQSSVSSFNVLIVRVKNAVVGYLCNPSRINNKVLTFIDIDWSPTVLLTGRRVSFMLHFSEPVPSKRDSYLAILFTDTHI